MTLFASHPLGDLIFMGLFLLFAVAWLAVESVAKARTRRAAPVARYDVVYPNGLKKTVEARDPEEAVGIVAGDANLAHDVVLYLDGRVAGVVRALGKGLAQPTWFAAPAPAHRAARRS